MLRFSLDLAAFSGAVPSPLDHIDKYVINDAHGLIRTQMKIYGNFPQIHLERHNIKKFSSGLPNLGGSQKNLPIQLIWNGSEEKFRLITS